MQRKKSQLKCQIFYNHTYRNTKQKKCLLCLFSNNISSNNDRVILKNGHFAFLMNFKRLRDQRPWGRGWGKSSGIRLFYTFMEKYLIYLYLNAEFENLFMLRGL